MAEEEITDLTEEGTEDGGKPAKKKRREKPPKEKKKKKGEETEPEEGAQEAAAADKDGKSTDKDSKAADKDSKELKAPTEKADKEKKTKSGGGTGGVIVIMFLLALILVGGIVGALYFDLFSARMITADFVRDPLLSVIVWLDPSFSSVNNKLLDEAQARENQQNAREEKLNQREEDLDTRESRIDTRETQLNRRATELSSFEKDLMETYERTVPLYRRDMTDEELADMLSYVETFNSRNMAPADAAEILIRVHTIQDVASILYYMGERDRAAIMAVFEPEFAAEITNVWIYN